MFAHRIFSRAFTVRKWILIISRLTDQTIRWKILDPINESTFFRSGNILYLLPESWQQLIGLVTWIPHYGHCPIVFDYILDFPYELTRTNLLSKLGGKQNRKTIDGALEAVDWDFELSDLPVTDMFSKLHYIMSPLVNLYVPLSQEK